MAFVCPLACVAAATGMSRLPERASAPSARVQQAHRALSSLFEATDWRTRNHIARVLNAFRETGLSQADFGGVNGYGHGDLGREKIDAIYAHLLGAERALVRVQFFSGTHAISCALFGVLRPGETLLTVTGHPYDTLEEVIGLRASSETGTRSGSLSDWGIAWRCVNLTRDGFMDFSAIGRAIRDVEAEGGRVAAVHVQRSCGYAWRRAIPVAEIGALSTWLDERPGPRPLLFVDNCYGEFVEECEPCAVGADLVAGSLIKNPGGMLAQTGGYVAGRADLVQAASNRLSAPGVEGGATLGQNRAMLQGIFAAPGVVGEALKGVSLAARVLEEEGFACNPSPEAHRADIVQAVALGSRPALVAFCEAVQRHSAVSSHVRPTPGMTAGYGDEVVFADGTFVDGSTIELSADGPLRDPFAVYMQGGSHWTHWAIVVDAFLGEIRGG